MSNDDIARLTAERDQAQSACQAWQDVYETIEAHIRDRIAMNDPAEPEAYLRIIHACIAGVTADSRRICASRWADNTRLIAERDAAIRERDQARATLDTLAHTPPEVHAAWWLSIGTRVRKKTGSSWQGRICGYYSTDLTPVGYCVESEREPGSVQIYPAAALELVPEG